MSETPHSGPSSPGLEQIEAELQAAFALLTDPVAPPQTALPHLRQARGLLLAAVGDDLKARDAIEPILLDQPDEDELFEAAESLRSHFRELEIQRVPKAAARARIYRRLRRGAVAGALLVVAVFLCVIWLREKTPGPWHGKYYQNANFRGPVRARRDKDLNFNWGKSTPMKALPTDGFSVRWDVCLEVAQPIKPLFQLIADDGARLFVDGERIVDIWRNSPGDTQASSVYLAPGSHHLRVEYYENTRWARVALRASFDGEKPRAIPRSMLRYSGNRYDGSNPCHDREIVDEQPESLPQHVPPTADDPGAAPIDDEEPGSTPSDGEN